MWRLELADEQRRRSAPTANYIAIIEDGGESHATGVWFPDLPGCFSAGDSLDEAVINAGEALDLWATVMAGDSKPMPPPRTLTQLEGDPEIAAEIARYMVAVIPLHREASREAAE